METKKEIVERLEATGAMTAAEYGRGELLEGYKAFERVLLKEVFQDGYSESLRAYDLISHLKSRASQYALQDSEAFAALIRDLERFSREVGALVNGARGELYASWALDRLRGRNEVLSNVELCFDGEKAEYDDVVITPQGVFIVEVKYLKCSVKIDSDGVLRGESRRLPGTYNVGERMRSKEHVLWKTIEPVVSDFMLRDQVHGLIVNANDDIRIEDEFGFVPVKSCGSVCYYIEGFDSGSALSDGQMNAIKSALLDAAVEIRHAPDIDFDRVRENFAETLMLMSAAAERREASDGELAEAGDPGTEAERCFTIPRWAKGALCVAGGVMAAGACAFCASRVSQVR